MASGRIRLTKGRTTFKGSVAVTKEAVSRKVVDVLKRDGILEKEERKVAEEQMEQYVEVTRAYYLAMLKGVFDLVNSSGVPLEYEEGERTNIRKVKKGSVKVYRGKFVRGEFDAVIKHSQSLAYRNKPYGLKDNLEVTFQKRWAKMSMDYAFRQPPSEEFFRKRTSGKSARLAFNSQAATWKQRANALSSYGRKSSMTHRYDAKKGQMHTQFRLTFPSLGPEFDFLRKAFLNARANGQLPNVTGEGATGIILAEAMRPMLRPYAAEVGAEWRKMIEEKLNKH